MKLSWPGSFARGVGEGPVGLEDKRPVGRVGPHDGDERIAVRIGVAIENARSVHRERLTLIGRVGVVVGNRGVVDWVDRDRHGGRRAGGLAVVHGEGEAVGPVVVRGRCVGDVGAAGAGRAPHRPDGAEQSVGRTGPDGEGKGVTVGVGARQGDGVGDVLGRGDRLGLGNRGVVGDRPELDRHILELRGPIGVRGGQLGSVLDEPRGGSDGVARVGHRDEGAP